MLISVPVDMYPQMVLPYIIPFLTLGEATITVSMTTVPFNNPPAEDKCSNFCSSLLVL